MIRSHIFRTLIDALKALDLNNPASNDVAQYLLKPLELLTKVSTNIRLDKKEDENNNANTDMNISMTTNDSEMSTESRGLNQSFIMEIDNPNTAAGGRIRIEIEQNDIHDEDDDEDDQEDDEDEDNNEDNEQPEDDNAQVHEDDENDEVGGRLGVILKELG